MNKFLDGVFTGFSLAELIARVACFTAGAFCLIELAALAALAAKYAALITYAMRGPASF